MIPEAQAQSYTRSDVVHIFGWTTVLQQGQPPALKITQTENGYRAENLSNTGLYNVTVYHRTYIPEGNIYIGGKAFQTKLPRILPGECLTLSTENYAPGYSRIVYFEEKSAAISAADSFAIKSKPWTGNPANGDFQDARKLPEGEPPPEFFLRP